MFGPFAGGYDDETLWNYEAALNIPRPDQPKRAVFHTKIKDFNHARPGSCSSRVVFNVPKAHTTGVELEFAVRPVPGLELSIAEVPSRRNSTLRSPRSTLISPSLTLAGRIDRHNVRQSSAVRFRISMAASATYGQRVCDNADVACHCQLSAMLAVVTHSDRPGKHPRNFVSGLPFKRHRRRSLEINLKLRPMISSFCRRTDFDSGLGVSVYVNICSTRMPAVVRRERGTARLASTSACRVSSACGTPASVRPRPRRHRRHPRRRRRRLRRRRRARTVRDPGDGHLPTTASPPPPSAPERGQ